ncbi:MAG: GNAT family N-acetyltransferase [Micrococcales bacterium]|nr:GNAT family N-acetyltransferase [Micrococcales bacterium]
MQPNAEVEVRVATVDDAAAIATVHVRSWQSGYAGIVPASYLDALDPETATERWRQWLAAGPADDVVTWVVTSGSKVVGFASVGPARDEDARRSEREVYSIYLVPEAWGFGAARELMRTVINEIGEDAPLSLWVVADSARARQFYRRHGFSPDGVEEIRERGGVDLTEVRYRRS